MGKIPTISLSGIKVKQITCVLILHFLLVRTCSTYYYEAPAKFILRFINSSLS